MPSTESRAAAPAAAVRVRIPADRAGQETARLYAEYGTRIYRHCLGQLCSREDAEDAVQNTFVRVHTALRRGVVPEFEAPWLYKIAHNVCLSRRLSAARRARVETPHDLSQLESRVAGRERVHDELLGLDGALAELPPHLRRAILLREWQGLSYAEVAQRLGVSQSAVETLIFRARRRLAQALERPARRLTGLVDLGSLLGTVKTFLGGAGAVKLAAGAAVLAAALVGGIEAEHALHGRLSAHPARPGSALPSDRTPPSSGGPVGPYRAAASGGRTGVAATSRPDRRGPVEFVPAGAGSIPVAAGARGGSERDTPQTPTGSGAASAQATVPGTPTASEPTPTGATGASPTIPSPTLPTPDPTLPTGPDPAVPGPTLPAPTLPEATVPDVTAPLPTDTSQLPTVPTLP